MVRHLYGRDHLDQVLATFGLILILNEGVRIVWGAAPMSVPVPDALSGSVRLVGTLHYPLYRVAIIAAGLATALGLHLLVNHTRLGMRLRAGASNGPMVAALGIDIRGSFWWCSASARCWRALPARWWRRSCRSIPAWAIRS